jgi:hypothetical protein
MVGLLAAGGGGVSVFMSTRQADSTALLLVGAIFLLLAVQGLNRGDLLHDLQETMRQIRQAVSGGDTLAQSVKTITHEGGRKRKPSDQ